MDGCREGQQDGNVLEGVPLLPWSRHLMVEMVSTNVHLVWRPDNVKSLQYEKIACSVEDCEVW